MAKKQVIHLNRDIARSPKRRRQIEDAIWLLLHLIDRADFGTGVVSGCKDEEIAQEMDEQAWWVKDRRQRLQRENLITCTPHGRRGMDIQIQNWIDPRTLSASAQAQRIGSVSTAGFNSESTIGSGIQSAIEESVEYETENDFVPAYHRSSDHQSHLSDLLDQMEQSPPRPPEPPLSPEEYREKMRRNPHTLWETAYGQLQLQMPREAFDTWLRGCKLLAHEDGSYILGVSNIYAREWLEHRLKKVITRTLGQVAGRTVEVSFVLWSEYQAKKDRHQETVETLEMQEQSS